MKKNTNHGRHFSFYPVGVIQRWTWTLYKSNKDWGIRRSGCFTASFCHVLNLIFSVLTTPLFIGNCQWRPEGEFTGEQHECVLTCAERQRLKAKWPTVMRQEQSHSCTLCVSEKMPLRKYRNLKILRLMYYSATVYINLKLERIMIKDVHETSLLQQVCKVKKKTHKRCNCFYNCYIPFLYPV